MLGFARDESRTIVTFRHNCDSTTDEMTPPGGFYHQLTPSLTEHLRDLIETALDKVTAPDAVDADIDRFIYVVTVDIAILRLHEFLSNEFQACHEEQAGVNLHLLYSAIDQTVER